MIEPIRYEIPFILPNKEKLQEYNEYLYNLDELIKKQSSNIEQKMYDYIQKKSGKQRMILGRKGYPLIFRFKTLLINHIYDQTFRETEKIIKENISVRLFLDLTEFGTDIPSYVAIQGWNAEFDENFIKEINKDLVIKEAKKQKIIKGNKSRTDTTVVEENVAYPTDSTLLEKGKMKIVKIAKKLGNLVGRKIEKSKKKVISGIRTMHKTYYEIKKFSRKRTDEGKNQLKEQYFKLIKGAKITAKSTNEFIKEIKARTKKESIEIKKKLQKELKKLEELKLKYEQVIKQTTERVIEGKVVPMAEKLISYVSESATIISKGKEGKSREVGVKLSVTEVEKGVISNWEVYEGNPNDATLLEVSLKNCQKAIGKIPKNNAFDRGYWDKKNIEKFEEEEKVNLHIPKRGTKSQADKKRESTWAFKTYQKFRSGGEGRISELKRGYGLRKLRVRGAKSTKIKISWGILTSNLKRVA